MSRLDSPLNLRVWEYGVSYVTNEHTPRPRHTINENLTGAVVGGQRPARISFQNALWLVAAWNRRMAPGDLKFRLVIPNPANP